MNECSHNAIDMRDVRTEYVQKNHNMKMNITQVDIGGH